MNNYESMLIEAEKQGLIIKEKLLQSANGRISGNRIAIRRDIPTAVKCCALAEELGHHYTNVGDILDQSIVSNRKQEIKAHKWAHDQIIGLDRIIKSYQHGCSNRFEMAEFLEVTEEFLQEAIDCYRQKYGVYTEFKGYLIMFIPNLCVGRII